MSTLIMLGIGAALMYFFDPDSGRRRRALLRDKGTSMVKKSKDAVSATAKNLSNRASGLVAGAKSSVSEDHLTDEVLVNRVRSEMGRVVSHPSAVQVTANQGRVTLTGAVLADEEEKLLEGVRSVRGVTDVENRLEVHTTADTISALREGRQR
jgi:Putative phospholipid-binding domain.